MPPFIYFLTQSIPLMCFSALSQTLALIFIYKPALLLLLRTGDIEEFVERFVEYGVTVMIFLVIAYSHLLVTLRKRTTELSKAIKSSEDTLEQQKTFVYSFSHELRNPINSLLGNLQLVLMGDIPHDIREMVNTSKICGELLLNLINTVLDAGKLDIGQLELSTAPTRIHDLLQRIWTISNDIIVRKNLKSHLKIDKNVPPTLLLDGHRVNQVLMNLLGNAVKFTQKGLISITIKWLDSHNVTDKSFEPIPYDNQDEGLFEKEENMYLVKAENQGKQPKDYFLLTSGTKEFDLSGVRQPQSEFKGTLKIIIKDTGCGMSQEDLNKLFLKFSQVGNDPTKKKIGTGLGLFISRKLCRNMKGDIRVYSKPGIGSTFIVCIPTTAIASRYGTRTDTSLNTIIKELQARKLRTIVADDSPFNVNLVTNFYMKIRAEVVATASNGQSAYMKFLECLEEEAPVDIVTLDIDMPIMNGKVTCEKIREYEREHNLKPVIIILISGNYEEQYVANFVGNGHNRKADCFLKKPLLFEELCWAVYKRVFRLD